MNYIPNSSTILATLLSFSMVLAGGLAAPAAAQGDQPEWGDQMYTELEGMVGVYNENVNAEDLGVAASQVRNERVNLVVTDSDGSQATASFRLDSELKIQELQQGTRDDATMKMSTDRQTVDRIVESNNPSRAFQNAIQNGDITIDGIGTINAVKWVVINNAANLIRSFF